MYKNNSRDSSKFGGLGSYQTLFLTESLSLRNRLLFIYCSLANRLICFKPLLNVIETSSLILLKTLKNKTQLLRQDTAYLMKFIFPLALCPRWAHWEKQHPTHKTTQLVPSYRDLQTAQAVARPIPKAFGSKRAVFLPKHQQKVI